MGDIKLFNLEPATPVEMAASWVALEKSLQNLIERHLETFLGVRFLATEYSTGKVHGGRIDTLGIDENGCPVIIEYKRSTNENVINQGLFYLDWLMDHRGEFELFVLKKLGQEVSDSIEWKSPRLVCIAGDFTKYDGHAVQQMNRNIQLVRYRRYERNILMLELVNSVWAEEPEDVLSVVPPPVIPQKALPLGSVKPTLAAQFANAGTELLDLYAALRAYLKGLGDDVEESHLKRYAAFKRIKNFACVVPFSHTSTLVVFVKVSPEEVVLEEGFTRDVSNIGHWGTGDLELTIRSTEDLERAKPLLLKSYEAS